MRLTNSIKHLLVLITASMATISYADESKIPEPFRGENNLSGLKVDYKNYNRLLRVAVIDLGRSDRKKAKEVRSNHGTRMKNMRKRLTTLEANRFYFEAFKNKENRHTLHNIRAELEQLPAKAPLYHFPKKEQLAYWLNLYNVTLLDEIVARYPKKNLKSLLEGSDTLLDQKILNVANVPLSLIDIKNVILKEKFNHDPDILYGLYQGYIGAPNIRTKAYTGDNVYSALAKNAREFVNSNRGTYSKNKNTFYISSLYKRNADYFPNFEADVTRNILKHLEGYHRSRLEDALTVKANISNWRITDVYGTIRNYGVGINDNPVALWGAVKGSNAANNSTMSNSLANAAAASQLGLLSPEQIEILSQLEARYMQNVGVVTVIDIGSTKSEKEQDTTK